MLQHLEGLRPEEAVACHIAERTLGVVAEPTDLPPHQGKVDAILVYPDDRRAAFEVTQLAMDGGARHLLEALLQRERPGWPLPGKWWWSVWIGHPRDLPRLRIIFEKVVLLCEAFNVTRPRDLPFVYSDADTRWLIEESSVDMFGHPRVPSVDKQRTRQAMLTSPGAGGFSDETFSLLDNELETALNTDLIQRHVAKLIREQADEHHLFMFIGLHDFPFPLFEALGCGDNLPDTTPSLPDGVTHLWLAPDYGKRVLVASRDGWRETRDLPQ